MNSIYSALSNLVDSGQPGVLCTIVSSKGSTPRGKGTKLLVYQDGSTLGSVGGGKLENSVLTEELVALSSGQSSLLEYNLIDPDKGDPGICGGQVTVFIDPILPRKKLVVIGGGHVGREVTDLANWLGFHVAICDDREAFSNPENIPKADDYYSEGLPEITSASYVVLTTCDVEIDLAYLPELIDSDAAYIGVIGSKRRWETTKKKLVELGIPRSKIDKIHSPIGLALKTETPRGIALSIMAEVVMLQKLGESKLMSSSDIK